MALSESDVKTEFGNIIKAFDGFRLYSGVTATTFLTRLDTYYQSIKGDYSPQALAEANRFRGALAQAINMCGAAFSPQILHYGQVISAPEFSVPAIMQRLRDYYFDNSLKVQSRVMTFGSVSASGSPTGTGTINRLNVDEWNQNIENCHGDTKTFEVTADATTGAVKHEEIFEIRGAVSNADNLLILGSGRVDSLRAQSARDSARNIRNPSFDSTSGSNPTITITGWTLSAQSAFDTDAVNYYRDAFGVSAPASMKITGNATATQLLSSLNFQANRFVPMYTQIAYNRAVGSGNGTLRLTVGSKTFEVVLSAQTGWNILRFSGHWQWYKNWQTNAPAITVAIVNNTSGYTLVDDLMFVPYQNFDGLWYMPIGAATDWLLKDKYTAADTSAETGIIQHWIWRSTGFYLPHANGSSITWSDP